MPKPLKLSGYRKMDDLTKALKEEGGDKLCIVMFTASWCGPCKDIKKRIYDENYNRGLCIDNEKKAVFFYVDIDDNKELAEEFKITSIPHFYFMKYNSSGLEMKCNFKGGSSLDEKIKEFC